MKAALLFTRKLKKTIKIINKNFNLTYKLYLCPYL